MWIRMIRLALPVFALVISSHCMRGPGSSSQTKITNGSADFGGRDVGAIVQISIGNARCTATFILPAIIVTAGHCLAEGVATFNGYSAVEQRIHPLYAGGVSPYDLAFARFPLALSPGPVFAIRQQTPALGESFEIIGFGVNDVLSRMGAGVKRLGRNRILDLSQNFIGFEGSAVADNGAGIGQDSASGSGDSGGPLLIDGKIAGITSGGGLVGARKGSSYVNLNLPANVDFMKQLSVWNLPPVASPTASTGTPQPTPTPTLEPLPVP